MKEQEVIRTYRNDGFVPHNTVVGWVDVGTTSRPITREVVGQVPSGIIKNDKGEEKIVVETYVRSYKNDYPLALLGGEISRITDRYEERHLTQFLSREYASKLSYSEFPSDASILFPGVELTVPSFSKQKETNNSSIEQTHAAVLPVLLKP